VGERHTRQQQRLADRGHLDAGSRYGTGSGPTFTVAVAFVAPSTTVTAAWSTMTLSNNRCTVNVAGTTVAGSGPTLTLNLSLSAASGWSGAPKGRNIVAQGVSPGLESPHPAFGTPLPRGRERGGGRGRVAQPTAGAV
jgi:hypothetical protein